MPSPSRYLHTALQLGFLSKPELATLIKEAGGNVSTAAPQVMTRLLGEGRITGEQDAQIRRTLGEPVDDAPGSAAAGSPPHRVATPASPPHHVVTPVMSPGQRDPAAAARVGGLPTRLNPDRRAGRGVTGPNVASAMPTGSPPAAPAEPVGAEPVAAEPVTAHPAEPRPVQSDVDVFGARSRDDFPPGTGFTEHGMFRSPEAVQAAEAADAMEAGAAASVATPEPALAEPAIAPDAGAVGDDVFTRSVVSASPPVTAEPLTAEPAGAAPTTTPPIDDVFTRSVVDAGGAIAAARAERSLGESTAAARHAVRQIEGDAAASPNRDFSAYQLGRIIDADEFVELREAFHPPLRRRVAIKTLLVGDDPLERARFSDEAKTLGHLDHPNILPLHDIGVDKDGRPFHVVKISPPSRLSDAINDAVEIKRGKRPSPPPQPQAGRTTTIRRRSSSVRSAPAGESALRTTTRNITAARTRPIQADDSKLARIGNRDRLLTALCDVCDAVDHAHANGILHGDLKTSSVLLGEHGEVLVTDWSFTLPLEHPVDHIEEDLDPSRWEAELTAGKVKVAAPEAGDATGAADGEESGDQPGIQTSETLRASAVMTLDKKRPTVRARGDTTKRDAVDLPPARSESDPPRVRTRSMPHAAVELGGAPGYVAPEVARGDIAMIDTRADVYALGAMLYEILGGERPFGNKDDDKAMELAAAGARVPGVRKLRAPWPVPRELEAIARRAMSPNPEHRQSSVSAFRAEIDAWWSARPTRSASYGPRFLARRIVRQHRIPAAILALGSVAGLAALVVTLISDLDRSIARVQTEAQARLDAPVAGTDDTNDSGEAADARRARANELVDAATAQLVDLPSIDDLEVAYGTDPVSAKTRGDRDEALASAMAVAAKFDRAAALFPKAIDDSAAAARATAGEAVVRLALLEADLVLANDAAAALERAPFKRADSAAAAQARIDAFARDQRRTRDTRLSTIIDAVGRGARSTNGADDNTHIDAYAREIADWNDAVALTVLMDRLKPISDEALATGHAAEFDATDRAVVALCARTFCLAGSADGIATLTTLLRAMRDLRLQTELATALASTRWPSVTPALAALAVRVGVDSPVWLPVAPAFAHMPIPTELESPTDPDRRLEAAYIAYAHGDFEEALTLCATAASADATDHDAHLVQARALIALSRPEDARAAMVRVTNANPRDAIALAVLAETYVATGDATNAERAYTRSLALMPGNGLITLERAQLFAAIGRLTDAVTDYSDVLQKDSAYLPALLGRAQVHALVGAYTDAIVDLTEIVRLAPDMARAYAERAFAQRMIGELNDARRDIERAIQLAPDSVSFRHQRARVMLDQGAPALADAEFARLLEIDAADAVAIRGRGLVAMARGAIDDALDHFRHAVSIDGAYASAWHDQGQALAKQRKHAEAIAAYTRAINILTVNRMADLAPNAPVWRDRGISLLATRQVQEAIDDLSAAIVADRTLADAYFHRARAHRVNGNNPPGEADTTAAIDAGYRSADVYSLRAAFREDRGDRSGAIEDATRAVRLAPTTIDYRLQRGLLLTFNNQPAMARAEYDEVLALDPDQPFGLANRANAAFLMGDYEAAIVDAERATEVMNQWQPWATLGSCYAALDEREKAEAAFEEAFARVSDGDRERLERVRASALGD